MVNGMCLSESGYCLPRWRGIEGEQEVPGAPRSKSEAREFSIRGFTLPLKGHG